MDTIYKDVVSGVALSKSFAKFPRIFSAFSVQILRVGESSGTLEESLSYLAEELKKRQALKAKVIGAFIYPALITVATLGITLFLTIYLFPKIMPVFASLGIRLPLPTRIMITLSTFLTQWGLVCVVCIACGMVCISFAARKFRIVGWYFDWITLYIPLCGRMMRFYYIASTSRTLGLLLSSGLQLHEALFVTTQTVGNRIYQEAFSGLAASVTRGDTISNYMISQKTLFPDIMIDMVAVGERSGTLQQTLVYLSDVYDSEVEEFTKNISTLIEPALMMVMGLLVGFIAVSIITPIYGITQNLHAQ